jgi:ribosomal protein S18 acetylase RimI-like enzyme
VSEQVRFEPAAAMSAGELAVLVSACFADTRYPPAADAGQEMQERIESEDIDLSRSVVARSADGAAIGVSLLAVRGQEAWCGGFGVVPSARGRGVGANMMEAQIRRAEAAGARHLRLEVLHDNDRAMRLYTAAGFRRERDVVLWRREGHALGEGVLPEVEAPAAADAIATLLAVRQTWQRTPDTLRRLARLDRARGAVWRRAAVLWRPSRGGATSLLGIAAVAETAARDALGDLLPHLDPPITIINEPVGTPAEAALRWFGFVAFDRQQELALSL